MLSECDKVSLRELIALVLRRSDSLKNGDGKLKFGLEILVIGYEAWKEEDQGMCLWNGSELGPLWHLKSKMVTLYFGENDICAFINEKIASILVLF